MNKIERVNAALKGEPVDRVPASFWFHFPKDQVAGKAMADAHLEYYRFCSPDFLKVMNDNGYEAPADSPQVIATSEQWADLYPAPLSSQPYQNQLDGLKRICDELKDDCHVITTIFCPYATGNHLSNNKVTEHARENPEAVRKGLMSIAESTAEFSRACIKAGATGIYYSAQGGDKGRFTNEEFESIVRPSDLAVLDAVHDAPFNLLHICGGSLVLERYADYPAAAVNWAHQLDNPGISEGRELFDTPSAHRAIAGGIDQRGPVVDGTRNEMRAEVDAALKEGGHTRFILGAGCTLPGNITWDNIEFVMNYVRA